MAFNFHSSRLWHLLLLPRTQYVLAWMAALIAAGGCLYGCWHEMNDPERADGNSGHVSIDFSGQWLMSRLLITGQGKRLFDRQAQRDIIGPAFPRSDQAPNPESDDAEGIMWSMMGSDHPAARAAASFLTPLAASDPISVLTLQQTLQSKGEQQREQFLARRVGGPLYPPIHALMFAPIGLMPPRTAYRVQQTVNILLAFLAALGLSLLAKGRFWWPLVLIVLLAFPGLPGSTALGQNAVLSLTILIWGWVLMARGWPGWGGLVWGLLAYKPVWAMAFFLVPVLTRRWRMAGAMVCGGTALALLTLPFVGVHSWLDWLAVGREAAALYNVDENWVFLSRDLLGIPRRWLLDFKLPTYERDVGLLAPLLIGWGMVVAVIELTVRVAVLRGRQAQAVDGPPAAFMLLGAWLGCYHFMHYDVLLAALPVFLMYTEPRRYLDPLLLVIGRLSTKSLDARLRDFYRVRPAETPLEWTHLNLPSGYVLIVNRMIPTLTVLLLMSHSVFDLVGLSPRGILPWETVVLIAIWLWCGWLWIRNPADSAQLIEHGADIR